MDGALTTALIVVIVLIVLWLGWSWWQANRDKGKDGFGGVGFGYGWLPWDEGYGVMPSTNDCPVTPGGAADRCGLYCSTGQVGDTYRCQEKCRKMGYNRMRSPLYY